MEYTVKDIEGGNLIVEFEDNSWAEVPVEEGMSESDIDDAVADFAPKPELTDRQIKGLVGQTRVAQKKPPEADIIKFESPVTDSNLVETDPALTAEDPWNDPDQPSPEEIKEQFKKEVKEEILAELNGTV